MDKEGHSIVVPITDKVDGMPSYSGIKTAIASAVTSAMQKETCSNWYEGDIANVKIPRWMTEAHMTV